MQDNDFATWRAYNNRYWPAKYFIDKEGYIRYTHFGEGEYDKSEQVIQELLKEAGAKGVSQEVNNPKYQVYGRTPETYLGYSRVEYLASPESIRYDGFSSYTRPLILPNDRYSLEGEWKVTKEYANPRRGSSLEFNFDSKEVLLVMSPSKGTAKVKVTVDDKTQFYGEDVVDGIVTIDSDRLYKLVNLPIAGRHTLRLEFLDDSALLYAFTFG